MANLVIRWPISRIWTSRLRRRKMMQVSLIRRLLSNNRVQKQAEDGRSEHDEWFRDSLAARQQSYSRNQEHDLHDVRLPAVLEDRPSTKHDNSTADRAD